jgi:short subunit dehydrogenase-like uncharacterized protein
MNVKRVFVSGATGYIGTLVSERLVSSGIELIIGGKNISNLHLMQRKLLMINPNL